MITVISISLLLLCLTLSHSLSLLQFLTLSDSHSHICTHKHPHAHTHTHSYTNTKAQMHPHTQTKKCTHARTNTHSTISSALDLLSKFSVPYLFNYETILPFNATSSLTFQLKNPFDLLKLFSFDSYQFPPLSFGFKTMASFFLSHFLSSSKIERFFSNILVVSVCRQGNNDCLRSDRNHGSLRSPSATSSTTASATS